MNNILKTVIFSVAAIFMFTRSSCDAFESFLFNLPISVTITATGTNNPSGNESYCLDDDETYQDFKDKINTVTFVEAYVTTVSVSPINLQGDVTVTIREGTNASGPVLFTTTLNNARPADYISPNPAYKLPLTEADIQAVNDALEQGVTCFYGELEVTDISNGATPPQQNVIVVKIDALYKVDADL